MCIRDRDLLQQALDIVLPKFEIFHVRLRQGIFWYYFEENVKRAPRVHEEETYPCHYIVPVSYTHLDVYKRQVEEMPDISMVKVMC